MIGAVGVFAFVAWGSQGVEVVSEGDDSFPADDVDDGFIFAYVVFHFFLDVCVVFEQILKMFLAWGEVLFESSVLVDKVLVDSVDFVAFLTNLVQVFAFVCDVFLDFFWIGNEILMMELS